MTRPIHALAAVIEHLEQQLQGLRAELQGVAAAAGEAQGPAEPPACSTGHQRPLSMKPAAIRNRRRLAKLKALGLPHPGRGAKRDPSGVIQRDPDHADHATQLDRARVVVDLDLDPEQKDKKGNARAKRVIHPLDRPKVHEDFRAAAKALGVEYPERDQVPFWEKRACELLLEEYKPEEIGRAREALAGQKRSGDAFERRKPFTLAYLRRNMLELLQSNPKPARPRRQLAFPVAGEDTEGPQPRIWPKAAPSRPGAGPAAAPELVKTFFETLKAQGL